MAKTHRDPWWKSEKNEVHKDLVATVKRLDDVQAYRREMNIHHLRLYSNRLIQGLLGSDWATFDTGDKLKLNAIKAVIDTAVSQISTERSTPMYLTSKGDYSARRRGKLLRKFSVGQFHAVRQYMIGLDVFRDACILGSGFEKIVTVDGKLAAERVFADDIVVDDVECREGNPRVLYQYRTASRGQIAAVFPKFKSEIEEAGTIRDKINPEGAIEQPVDLLEAWRLPSTEGGKDGRHAIVIDSATLFDEPWTRNVFPFAKFDWSTSPRGYFGCGLAEEICPIQVEINYLLQKIQRLMTLATSQVWIENGSKINTSALSNEDFAARTYTGRLPVFMAPQSVSPEYFAQIDRLWSRAFEVSGVSQMNATAQKPVGIEAGVALRTLGNIASKRFQHTQQRWEQFHLDVAALLIDEARDLSEQDGGYKILAKDRAGIEELDFKDVDLDRDKYIMQAHPTSFLPETPSGKMQTIKELSEIAPGMAQTLIASMQYPDLEGMVSLETAPIELTDLLIEQMLEDGVYRPPEPFMDLALAQKRMNLALLRAEIQGAPEARLDLVRQFLAEVQALANPPQASAPAPQPEGLSPGAPPPMQAPPGTPDGMPPDAAMMPPTAA